MIGFKLSSIVTMSIQILYWYSMDSFISTWMNFAGLTSRSKNDVSRPSCRWKSVEMRQSVMENSVEARSSAGLTCIRETLLGRIWFDFCERRGSKNERHRNFLWCRNEISRYQSIFKNKISVWNTEGSLASDGNLGGVLDRYGAIRSTSVR